MNLPMQGSKALPYNLVFNKSAIARLLRVPPSTIADFAVLDSITNVFLKAAPGSSRGTVATVKNSGLEHEFHRFRMDAGADLEAHLVGDGHFGERWDVPGSKGDTYKVEVAENEYRCTCEDWHQHQTKCKHGWAVHFAKTAIGKLSCHDCGHWTPAMGGICKLRAETELEQLPITHAEVCSFLVVGFEEW